MTFASSTLASSHDPMRLGRQLSPAPRPLQFGTSGRRGLLADLSQLEIFINALAELEYLQSLPADEGGILRGDDFFLATDLRPSSTSLIGGRPNRGELAQAIVAAIRAAGMNPVYCGAIPTPALTAHALLLGKGSMMVTGSHIPFDRNGYKTNTARGELLKHHEHPINEQVASVRARVYAQSLADSPFGADGQFKDGHRQLPAIQPAARENYLHRYLDFFPADILAGLQIVMYQHSAVGRDLVPEILRGLGAEVIEAGRSESFVPIDTENIDQAQLGGMQSLIDAAAVRHGPVDALVSTDGDSDRPLIVGVDPVTHRAQFFGGDLVGMIAAEYLAADAVVVPISCNDAIDRGTLRDRLEPRTRIGSPFVIAGMQAALARGRQAVCGWEANGGFLTGSTLERHGRRLAPLPTRDAVLPIIAVLAAARERGIPLTTLFQELPRRYSRAALLRNFPRAQSLALLARHSPPQPGLCELAFAADETLHGRTATGEPLPLTAADVRQLLGLRATLATFFTPEDGFDAIVRINTLDGLRLSFGNGDIAHLRPSGNADELRIYAVADSQARADAIVARGVAEPDGILRRLAASPDAAG
ncbi:phosphohexomutase domain-containing protein [Methyloparacoccus murrellii]